MKYIRYVFHQIWYFICCCVSIGITLCLTRPKVYGKKNVPKKGSLLILANHQSYLDPMLCQWSVFPRFSWHVARSTLYTNKWFGMLLATLNTIPINRGEADLKSMRAILNKLKEGKPVCLYPEATRTHDGRIIDIKPGVTLLSRRSGADVLPITIEGAYEAWPRHQKLPHTKKALIQIGEVITAERIKEMGDKAFAQLLTRELRRMQNELRVKMGRPEFDYSNSEGTGSGD